MCNNDKDKQSIDRLIRHAGGPCVCRITQIRHGFIAYLESSAVLSFYHLFMRSFDLCCYRSFDNCFGVSDKTMADKEREGHLIDQWVSLTEERNNVLCPAAGSGVPGAPLEW